MNINESIHLKIKRSKTKTFLDNYCTHFTLISPTAHT